MTEISSQRLAGVVVEVADTLVDEFDLISFLQMVTAHTSALIAARAAGLLLADTRGHLQLMAASDERQRWLSFSRSRPSKARARTATSTEARSRSRTFVSKPSAGHTSLRAPWRQETIGLIQERAIRQSELLAAQLQSDLESHILIEQAKGALAQLGNSTPDEAYEWLRTYCRNRGLKLADVARNITTDPHSLPDLL